MRRAGPRPGVLIAADPATVERSGFAIRESRCFRTVRIRGSGQDRPNRKSHWSGITICRGRTPLNLRIVHLFVMPVDCGPQSGAKHSGKARRTRSSHLGRGAVSQETCHPQGPHIDFGVRPIQGEMLPMPARRLSWLYHPVPGTARLALPRMPVFVRREFLFLPARAEPGSFHDIDKVRLRAGSGRRPFRQIRFRRETGDGVGSAHALRRDRKGVGRRDAGKDYRASRSPRARLADP